MVFVEPEFEAVNILKSEKYEGTEVDPSVLARE